MLLLLLLLLVTMVMIIVVMTMMMMILIILMMMIKSDKQDENENDDDTNQNTISINSICAALDLDIIMNQIKVCTHISHRSCARENEAQCPTRRMVGTQSKRNRAIGELVTDVQRPHNQCGYLKARALGEEEGDEGGGWITGGGSSLVISV